MLYSEGEQQNLKVLNPRQNYLLTTEYGKKYCLCQLLGLAQIWKLSVKKLSFYIKS